MSDQSISAQIQNQVEIWKPVLGWPYEVSDFGRVRRSMDGNATRKGFILNSTYGRYLLVNLSNRKSRWAVHIHKLVATAFLGECLGFQVNHKDGNKHNNRADNLEYVTGDGNMQHAVETSLIRQGQRHPRAKLNSEQVIEIRRLYSEGVPQVEIAKIFGRHPSSINHVVSRRLWKNI